MFILYYFKKKHYKKEFKDIKAIKHQSFNLEKKKANFLKEKECKNSTNWIKSKLNTN